MFSIGFCNSVTNEIIKEKIESTIRYFSTKNKVDVELIKAIIHQESSGLPYAVKYEKHLPHADWYLATLTDEEKKEGLSFCSLGCMQVLFGIAKAECGYTGTADDLISITNSINYGSKFLRVLIKRHWILEDVISAYNQGSPKKDKNGRYCNQAYVNSVMKKFTELTNR